ncbi:ABC transporter [Leucobacter albus]|uniref:ABC transporter n=1 Tax=Leucobacter albus TaxID=272210 RepID=A0ABW3TIV6_9MICO
MKRLLYIALACGVTLPLALVACAPASPQAPAPPTQPASPHADAPGHGAISGATEAAEPQLQLLTVSHSGEVGLLNLLDGSERTLDPLPSPQSLITDGRYVFGVTSDGVTVTDGGAWTWDHGDHFHYYSAEPAQLGLLRGAGPARVTGGPLSTSGGTGVFFAGSGEAVLLDNAKLHDGTIGERFRVSVAPHDGVIAPLGDGAVVSEPTQHGASGQLRAYAPDGAATDTVAPCDSPHGATATRAGVVVLCTGGAVLASAEGASEGAGALPEVTFTEIPVAAATPDQLPLELAGRKGRPTLAGVAADGSGVWVLDARARSWSWISAAAPLTHATAVGDDAEHVVALDTSGRVRVYRGGEEIGLSEPLLDPSDLGATDLGSTDLDPTGLDPSALDADARAHARVTLTVDDSRAYVNSPARGVVSEIDFADAARVARELRPGVSPVLFAEVGR